MSRQPILSRVLSLILILLTAVGLCACGKEPARDPYDYEETAERFIEAYYLRDYATRFSLTFYDARRQWEDNAIKDTGSEEAFFATVQQQADEKGIDVTVDSFDSYYAAYHQFVLQDCQKMYGNYTVTTRATDSKKLEGETLDEFRRAQLGAIDANYVDADAFNAVTEAYTVTVNIRIDGDKNTYDENYLVHLVQHDGRWLVVSHSI